MRGIVMCVWPILDFYVLADTTASTPSKQDGWTAPPSLHDADAGGGRGPHPAPDALT